MAGPKGRRGRGLTRGVDRPCRLERVEPAVAVVVDPHRVYDTVARRVDQHGCSHRRHALHRLRLWLRLRLRRLRLRRLRLRRLRLRRLRRLHRLRRWLHRWLRHWLRC